MTGPIHPGGPQLRCPGFGRMIGVHGDGCCERHELDARRADLHLATIVERSVSVRAMRAFAEPAS